MTGCGELRTDAAGFSSDATALRADARHGARI
jgi:hypothetical protein